MTEPGTRRSCILIELTDGSMRAFNYPDEESAETWHRECREEWNAGRRLIFYLRRTTRFGAEHKMYDGDEVTHLEITTRDDAIGRGADCRDALIFG